MSRVVLVTGAAGFIGRHAAAELRSRGWTVLASARSRADLSDPEAGLRLVLKAKPRAILHAAGSTRAADAAAYWDANVSPTINVLEAALRLPRPPRVVVVGSAAEYGAGQGNRRAREDGACRPLTPYGA